MASWSERRQKWVDSREEAQNNASAAAAAGRSDATAGERRPPNAWPFILAAGIVVVLLAGIFLAARFAPAEDNVTQAQLLTDSITEFVEAQNNGDAEQLRSTTCDQQVGQLITGTDEAYEQARAADVAENGKLVVDGAPTDYEINGDRGIVTVPTKLEKIGTTSIDQWKFVRVDDEWLVCNV
ncbi:Rv0361 family membrane protein [Rhodococcus sp. P1Y]|uniref:Rv0361 family membrane protein n=1 Tax=Rhodococcus sp. P1Y TaxID=1302308 RepID=UPI000EAC0B33|nr:hypothetical protein [Rhodococcus sp. P1Y]AYJ51226.1 hypothetical protein D8W71_26295 [Rhodococcus sp. P1Y]